MNTAYKTLDEPDQLEYCQAVWEEAKANIDKKVLYMYCYLTISYPK